MRRLVLLHLGERQPHRITLQVPKHHRSMNHAAQGDVDIVEDATRGEDENDVRLCGLGIQRLLREKDEKQSSDNRFHGRVTT